MEPDRTQSAQTETGQTEATQTTLVAKRSRLLVGTLAPLLTVVGIVGPIVATYDSLPDPMAVSWQGDRLAENAVSPSTFLLIQSVSAVICAALFVLGGWRRFKTPIYNGLAATVAASIAPVLVVVSISTVGLNRNQPDWTEVASPGAVWVAATILAPLLAIAPVAWLMRDTFKTPAPVGDQIPSAGLALSETETAAWHSQATARWTWLVAGPVALIAVLATVGGVFALGAPGIVLGLSMVGVALAILALTSVSVSVDQRGLTVRYGPLPWPVSRFPLTAIEVASALDVRPMEHGGWGYRGSRKLFGKAAVVVRRGEGIRLGLRDGTEFVVTVDDADRGDGVLNDLRAASV